MVSGVPGLPYAAAAKGTGRFWVRDAGKKEAIVDNIDLLALPVQL